MKHEKTAEGNGGIFEGNRFETNGQSEYTTKLSPKSSTPILLSKWHRKMCRRGNKFGWCVEDSFETLINALDDAGLVDKSHPRLTEIVKSAWVTMAQSTYLPIKLRSLIYQHLDEDGITFSKPVKRQRPMPLDLSNLMGGN